MATSSVQFRLPATGSDLAQRTGLGVLVGTLALLVTRSVVFALDLDVGPTGAESPFGTLPIVTTMVVAGIGAAIAYAALVRFTERPVRNFVVVAAAVFVVMLVPVVAFAPTMGVTPVGQVVLGVFHAVAAIPLVAAVLGVGR